MNLYRVLLSCKKKNEIKLDLNSSMVFIKCFPELF